MFEYKVDGEGRLKSMFWRDSQLRRDYQDYVDVTIFYSTYKMNRYEMSFIPFVCLNNHRSTIAFGCAIISDKTEGNYVWLLIEAFMRAMCQQMPKPIITDRDAAMIRAIQKVFPNVWHRLCTWHIKRKYRHLQGRMMKVSLHIHSDLNSFKDEW